MDWREMIGGGVWLGLAGFVAVSGAEMGIGVWREPGPGFLLFWSGLGLGLLAAVLLVAAWRRREEAAAEERPFRLPGRAGVLVVAALALYCWVLPRLGYLASTAGLMLVLFGLGRLRPRAVLAGALLASLLSYVLFHHLLKVPLPPGILAF